MIGSKRDVDSPTQLILLQLEGGKNIKGLGLLNIFNLLEEQ